MLDSVAAAPYLAGSLPIYVRPAPELDNPLALSAAGRSEMEVDLADASGPPAPALDSGSGVGGSADSTRCGCGAAACEAPADTGPMAHEPCCHPGNLSRATGARFYFVGSMCVRVSSDRGMFLAPARISSQASERAGSGLRSYLRLMRGASAESNRREIRVRLLRGAVTNRSKQNSSAGQVDSHKKCAPCRGG